MKKKKKKDQEKYLGVGDIPEADCRKSGIMTRIHTLYLSMSKESFDSLLQMVSYSGVC